MSLLCFELYEFSLLYSLSLIDEISKVTLVLLRKLSVVVGLVLNLPSAQLAGVFNTDSKRLVRVIGLDSDFILEAHAWICHKECIMIIYSTYRICTGKAFKFIPISIQ